MRVSLSVRFITCHADAGRIRDAGGSVERNNNELLIKNSVKVESRRSSVCLTATTQTISSLYYITKNKKIIHLGG